MLTGEATNGVTAGTAAGSFKKSVDLVQKVDGWTGDNGNAKIGGQSIPTIAKDQTKVVITVDAAGNITWSNS